MFLPSIVLTLFWRYFQYFLLWDFDCWFVHNLRFTYVCNMLTFIVFMLPPVNTDQWHNVCYVSVHPSIHSSVHSFVTKLVNVIFWKWMNWFQCKLGQMFRGAKAWNDQRWGSGGQRSRSLEADVRFRGLAEAS